jgi:hypothetical protein
MTKGMTGKMDKTTLPIRSAVKRDQAENYLLISLTSFAASVIGTRLFLQATGYPQLGNNVLHIAHALWGGLFLMISALLPLILANRWVFTLSAALNGLGIGLFIDEVGKFITQTNDYFYPPAAPLIYAFFLLLVLIYFFVRRLGRQEPRAEFYQALSDLHELADNNLDLKELAQLLVHLEIARKSNLPHVAGLAMAIQTYLHQTEIPLVPEFPNLSRRFMTWLRGLAERVGRPRLRLAIMVGFILMAFEILFSSIFLVYVAFSPSATLQGFLSVLLTRASGHGSPNEFWYILRIGLELVIGILALLSASLILSKKEYEGIHIGVIALLMSLTGLLLLSFYLDQFGALSMAFTQFPFLLLVLAYRRWYLSNGRGNIKVLQDTGTGGDVGGTSQ